MFVRLFDSCMSPYAKRRATKLRPAVHPAVVLGWSLTIGHPLDLLDQRAPEVDLAGMGQGELNDKADVRVDWRRTGLAGCPPVSNRLRMVFCDGYD